MFAFGGGMVRAGAVGGATGLAFSGLTTMPGRSATKKGVLIIFQVAGMPIARILEHKVGHDVLRILFQLAQQPLVVGRRVLHLFDRLTALRRWLDLDPEPGDGRYNFR
jgi:hypothetical protein